MKLHLHALYWVRQAAGLVDEVSVLHVLRDSLEEAQRLVEHDRHGDFGQFLHMKTPEDGPTLNTRCVSNYTINRHVKVSVLKFVSAILKSMIVGEQRVQLWLILKLCKEEKSSVNFHSDILHSVFWFPILVRKQTHHADAFLQYTPNTEIVSGYHFSRQGFPGAHL